MDFWNWTFYQLSFLITDVDSGNYHIGPDSVY